MSNLFNFSNFESDNEFDFHRVRSSTGNLTLDANYIVVHFKNKKIFINDIEIPLGTGLVSFCDADLITGIKLPKEGMMQKQFNPTTPEEYFDIKNLLFQQSHTLLKPLSTRHTYITEILPIFPNDITKGVTAYYGHLFFLQTQFREMIKITFDADFYPEDMEGLSAEQRFFLYTAGNPEFSPPAISRHLHIGKLKKKKGGKYVRAEGDIGVAAGTIERLKSTPVDFSFEYKVNSLYEMLFLEFYLMLENELRIKKCRNCGEYFVFRGNDITDYCSKVREGETLTCQKIIANQNFKNKLNDNEAFRLYNKYYKRYFARTKVGTIKEPAFKKWQYEALFKRDLCADGELSSEDFEQFLMDSFPNRKPKE